MPKKRDPVGRCPRCGLPYISSSVKTVNGLDYTYIYHGKEDGRPVYCYIGPRDTYRAVAGIKGADISNLELENVFEVFNLLASIVYRLRRRNEEEKKSTELSQLASSLRVLAREIEKMARDLEAEAELLRGIEEKNVV